MKKYYWKRSWWRLLILLFCWLLFNSCTRKIYVPVEHTYTEKVVVRDTIVQAAIELLRDSVVVADTVSFLKNKYAASMASWTSGYLNHTLSTNPDSFPVKINYIEKEIRIEIPTPYPVEVIKKVEKELNRWQKVKLFLGEIFFWLIIVVGLGYLLKIRFR